LHGYPLTMKPQVKRPTPPAHAAYVVNRGEKLQLPPSFHRKLRNRDSRARRGLDSFASTAGREKQDAEAEINRLLADADQAAYETILTHKSNTHKLAQALLERETLTCDEVLELLNLKSPEAAILA